MDTAFENSWILDGPSIDADSGFNPAFFAGLLALYIGLRHDLFFGFFTPLLLLSVVDAYHLSLPRVAVEEHDARAVPPEIAKLRIATK